MVKGAIWRFRKAGGRVNFLIAVSFILTGLLSGCGAFVPPTPEPVDLLPTVTERPRNTPVVIVTPVEEGFDLDRLNGVKIQFWHPWNGDTQDVLIQLVDQFNQSNTYGIHVIMQEQGSAGANEANLWKAVGTQSPPQVIVVSPQMLLALDERMGKVVNLDRYLSSKTVGMTSEQVLDFDQGFWQEDTLDGKRFGIPVQRSMTVLFYNLTWAKELGFSSIPESPEDLQAQVCSANRSKRLDTDLTNDGIGGMLSSRDSDTMIGWMRTFGADILDRNGYRFDTSDTEKAYQYLLSLFRDACMWERKNPQPYEYFAKRQALIYSGQLQDIPAQTAANQRIGSTDVWGVIPFPGEASSWSVTNGFSLGIMESDPDQDLAAWLFIRWLSEPAQQARLLTTFRTLPLGKTVLPLVSEIGAVFPQWNTAVRYMQSRTSAPLDADWIIVRQVVEDSTWQLFQPTMTSPQVKPLLQQMDELAAELGLRYP